MIQQGNYTSLELIFIIYAVKTKSPHFRLLNKTDIKSEHFMLHNDLLSN